MAKHNDPVSHVAWMKHLLPTEPTTTPHLEEMRAMLTKYIEPSANLADMPKSEQLIALLSRMLDVPNGELCVKTFCRVDAVGKTDECSWVVEVDAAQHESAITEPAQAQGPTLALALLALLDVVEQRLAARASKAQAASVAASLELGKLKSAK